MAINQENIDNIQSAQFDWISGRASCQIGGRASNQDAWGAMDTPHGFLVVVCDGMGGGPAGEIASKVAVENILLHVNNAEPEESRLNIVIKAIRQANEAIIRLGMDNPMYQGMGSTCIVLLISQQSAIAAYVGDSRIYQLQGTHKKWRTFDHSMVFGLVRHGVITEEQARLSAQSNVITRALGIKLDVEVDAFELPYEKGDRFVLTTDGLHGSMPEPKLIERMANRKDPMNMVVDNLVKEVENIGESNGSQHDNHTIAMVDVKKNSILKEKMNKKTKLILLCMAVLLALSLALNIVLLCCGKDDGYNHDLSIPIENEYGEAIDASYTEDNLENGFSPASEQEEEVLTDSETVQAQATEEVNLEESKSEGKEDVKEEETTKAKSSTPNKTQEAGQETKSSTTAPKPTTAPETATSPKKNPTEPSAQAAPKKDPTEVDKNSSEQPQQSTSGTPASQPDPEPESDLDPEPESK